MHYSIDRQVTPGPSVRFTCPKCGAAAIEGSSYELHETLKALHLLPLYTARNTYVVCGHCQARLSSRLTLDELFQHCSADLSPYVSYEVSFVFKFLAITALLLSWAPLVGLVLALIAVAGTFRVRGWPRTLALVSVVASFAIPLLLVVLAAVAQSL
jgi:hypothetical protein